MIDFSPSLPSTPAAAVQTPLPCLVPPQEPYSQFKQFVAHDKQALPFPSRPVIGADADTVGPVAGAMRDASGLSAALQTFTHEPQQQSQEAPLFLDRLTFNFDPAAADLAPLVMENHGTNTSTNTSTSTSASASTSTSTCTSTSSSSNTSASTRASTHTSTSHSNNSKNESSLPSAISPLVSPLSSLAGLTSDPTTHHVYASPSSSSSDRSLTAPSPTTPSSSIAPPLSLPIPAPYSAASPHSPSSNTSVSAQALPQAGSIAGSASGVDLGSNAGSPPRPSPSVLSAPHSGSARPAAPSLRRSSSSRWSASETSALAELSLVHKPIHHLKVTTAKTKAASVSRRKVAAPFKCPVPGCESSFTRALNLRGHLRSHTDERPYACRYCERSFARAHDKRRHEKLHLNIRPHVCECCGKMFARLDALNRHHRQEGDACVPPHHAGLLGPDMQHEMHASVPMGTGSNEYAFGFHSTTPTSSSLPSPGAAPMGTPSSMIGYMPWSSSQSGDQSGMQPHHHRQNAGPPTIPQGHTFHHALSVMGSAPHATHGVDHLGMGLYTSLNDMPHHRMGSMHSSMPSAPDPVVPMKSVPAPSAGVMSTTDAFRTPLPTPGPLSMPVEHGLLTPGPMDWNASGPLPHDMPNEPAWPQSTQRFAGHVL